MGSGSADSLIDGVIRMLMALHGRLGLPNGTCMTSEGRLGCRAQFEEDYAINHNQIATLVPLTRAYIRHLLKADETFDPA